MQVNVRQSSVNNRAHNLFTEPNQAFSVRQIIEQFARGETTAKTFEPSDDINDTNYSESQMMGIVDNLDEFEQRQYLMDLQESLNNEKDNQAHASFSESTQGPSEQTTDGVSSVADSNQNDTQK